jgi:PAS domain-containing protein
VIDDQFAVRVAAEIQAQVAIVNREGNVIARSHPSSPIGTTLLTEALILHALREKHRGHTLRAEMDETSVYFAKKIADQAYIWIVTVDSRQANAAVIDAGRGAMLIAALLGILSALVLGWLAHLHARRLRALRNETEATVQRLFGSATQHRGGREIDSLAASMRLMTARLVAHAKEMQSARDAAETATREIAKSEQARRESEEQLRALLDGMPDRAWLKDTAGRYVALNRSEANALGRPTAEVIGKRVLDFWQRRDQALTARYA